MRARVFASHLRVMVRPATAAPTRHVKPLDWEEKWMSVTS